MKLNQLCIYVTPYHEHLRDVTSAEDFVNGGELLGFMRGEVRGERAFLGASATKKLAGGAGSCCI